MADREGGGSSPWLAFLAGIVLVAVIAFGIVAYSGGFQQQRTAELEVDLPDTNINPPDIDLPEPPPAPTVPPSAEPAPAETAPEPTTP
ncbi:MAG TPA: hypothetical protein VEA80_15055 [Vitreimonas sp.]|uniref:hypothetical protein n=1 Tax=Vitreimonas sp. TaxID=3069702 RepID=UPI002D68A748|nr:hypothetical protein [Vitreimonas sp.]HYD88791.1 hypothetical protein [Vitreimonas sp.]